MALFCPLLCSRMAGKSAQSFKYTKTLELLANGVDSRFQDKTKQHLTSHVTAMEHLTRLWSMCSAFVGKMFPTHSLADEIGALSEIAYNPAVSLAVICALHLIIVLVVFPFYVMSYIVSTPGSWLLFAMLIVWLSRFVARSMMFPGALLPVQRSISKEILRGNNCLSIAHCIACIVVHRTHTSWYWSHERYRSAG